MSDPLRHLNSLSTGDLVIVKDWRSHHYKNLKRIYAKWNTSSFSYQSLLFSYPTHIATNIADFNTNLGDRDSTVIRVFRKRQSWRTHSHLQTALTIYTFVDDAYYAKLHSNKLCAIVTGILPEAEKELDVIKMLLHDGRTIYLRRMFLRGAILYGKQQNKQGML
jgi:hypothetical protein